MKNVDCLQLELVARRYASPPHSVHVDDDAGTMGLLFTSPPDMASDPWTSTRPPVTSTTYATDTTGSASVSFSVAAFSLTAMNPVASHAVVVHDASGNRVGCGVLLPSAGEVVTLSAYPGNANDNTTGTLVVTQGGMGVSLMGTVTNAQPECTDCGLHIHTGINTTKHGSVSAVGEGGGGLCWHECWMELTNHSATISVLIILGATGAHMTSSPVCLFILCGQQQQ